jgi:phage-related minor tail protein
MANNIKGLTVEIGGDTTKLGKALEDVNKKSKDLSSELGEINRLLRVDPGNTDLLAQKQKILAEAVENTAEKLKRLKEAEKQVQEQFKRGEVSEEQVRALQREIVATEQRMAGYERAIEETDQALRGLDDTTEDAEESSGKLGETLATVAKTGLAAVATAATALVTGLVASAEATREYRREMGKLETAFTTNGHSSEAAVGAYKELQGVLGETDQAVEAANHLALLTDNEKDLATWTGDILPGIFATFGASLPLEGLTEAANHTAKLGEVQGPLADALEWVGITTDDFNASLAACSTEQERAALIMSTLQGVYGEASATYKETNAEVIRANQANEKWMASMAGVGGAIEPILTDVKMMGAALLSDAVPGVQALAEAFRGLLNGEDGASADFGAAVSDLVTGLITKITEAIPKVAETGLAIITALATSIWQQLPVMLAQGREILLNLSNGIRENLPSLVSQALDIITNFAQSIYNGAPKLIETGFEILSNLVAGIMSSLPELIARVPEIISTFANTINDNFPTILKKGAELIWQIIKGIISAIPTLIANIPKIITAIVDVWEAFNWLNLGKKAITFLKDGVLKMAGAVKSAGKNILDAITNVIKNLPQNLLNLGKSAISDLGGALRNGVSTVKTAATSILNGVINTIKGLPSKMLTIGKDLVKGLWNGISDMTGWIIGKIQSFGSSVLSGIKKFFGIKSPSRVFRDEVGAMLAEGMAEGIEASADAPLDAMAGLSNDLLAEADGLNGLTLERKMQHTFAEPAAATAGGGLLDKLDRILAAIERGQVLTIDKDLLIGGTATDYDKTLGQRRVLAARGAL